MSKAITFDDDVYRAFMELKSQDAALLHVADLTINNFMRRLLAEYRISVATGQQ